MAHDTKAAVLRYLVEHANQWVPGSALTSDEVGGSEGLRRLRELRNAGQNIRSTPSPTGGFLYRLDVRPKQQPLPDDLQPTDVRPPGAVYICKTCLTRQTAEPVRRLVGDWVEILCDVCRKTTVAGPA